MNSDFSNEFWENIFKLKYLKELKIQNVELINQDLENISQIFEEDFTILEKLDISYNYGISETVLKNFLLTVKKEKPEIIYIIYEGSCRIKEEAIQDLYKILPGRIRIIPIKY
jgi:Ran GTPase-activating protein (RanGAP) involved in mRNA processing and transport